MGKAHRKNLGCKRVWAYFNNDRNANANRKRPDVQAPIAGIGL
jgi:hypothetical protein